MRVRVCLRPDFCLSGFATEFRGGHGSHTAGTAAGAILDSAEELECGDGEELGCLGGCLESSVLDQLVANTSALHFDAFCPAHGCDGFVSDLCLDDGLEMLSANGGVAPGAKLAVFDVIPDNGMAVWANLAGNGLWEAAEETGTMVHSNSWGTVDLSCEVDTMSIAFDTYMYEVSCVNILAVRFCLGYVGIRSSIHRRSFCLGVGW